MHADQAKEIERACRRLRIMYDDSRTGVHLSNTIAERGNQFVEGGTTTCLIDASLPTPYWPFAAGVFCRHHNTQDFGEGTAWKKSFGEESAGKLIPFGAAVLLKASFTRRMHGKFRPKGILGIFTGYKFFPGGRWAKRYMVWPTRMFREKCLREDAGAESRVPKPHDVAEVHLWRNELSCPLKDRYEHQNGPGDDYDFDDEETFDDDDDGDECPEQFGDVPDDDSMYIPDREFYRATEGESMGTVDDETLDSRRTADDESDAAPAIDVNYSPNDDWERLVREHRLPERQRCDNCILAPAVAAPSEITRSARRIPRSQVKCEPHRPKSDLSPLIGLAMVARPAGRAELARSREAQESMEKEWSRLIQQGVWDLGSVREK